MKKQIKDQTKKINDIKDLFIAESVQAYLDENNVFDALRAIKFVIPPAVEAGVHQSVIADLQSLEMLLLDFAEADTKATRVNLDNCQQILN